MLISFRSKKRWCMWNDCWKTINSS